MAPIQTPVHGYAGLAALECMPVSPLPRCGRCLPSKRPDVLGLRSLFAPDRGVLDALYRLMMVRLLGGTDRGPGRLPSVHAVTRVSSSDSPTTFPVPADP